MTKKNPNNCNQTKSDIFPWDILESNATFFYQKNIEVFQWLSKPNFLSFMTKLNRNNRNETKSDIFSWKTFKYDLIFSLLKNINVFQWLSKSTFFLFYDYGEPKQWKWNKIRHFSMGYIQIWSHTYFYQKILNYFIDFQNQNFSILWLKWTQTLKMKQNQIPKFFSFMIKVNPNNGS